MKLNFWNWVHLISPFVIAGISLHYKLDNTYWNCLFGTNIFMVLFGFLPFMATEEKTGRTFKTKYGKFEEYRTVESKYNPQMTFYYILLFQIAQIILFFIL